MRQQERNMSTKLAAGLATAGVFSLLVLLTWPSSGASSPSSLLEFVVPDVEPRARISFLPMHMLPELETELETDTYPPTYNNHKLRAAACFGFEHTVSAARPVPWTPDDHALWCQTASDMRIGDSRMRGNADLRVGRLIGEGNSFIDMNEYNNPDASVGEAQRDGIVGAEAY